jgi:hypothetical protein
MVRRRRMPGLMPDQRDELLIRAYALRQAATSAMAIIDIAGRDYRSLVRLTPQLNEFAAAISDGEANFGHLAGSTPMGKPQSWEGARDRFDEDIDAAIELCGGDERAAIRSLLVLTEFLELEAFGETGVQYRRERSSR